MNFRNIKCYAKLHSQESFVPNVGITQVASINDAKDLPTSIRLTKRDDQPKTSVRSHGNHPIGITVVIEIVVQT